MGVDSAVPPFLLDVLVPVTPMSVYTPDVDQVL